MSVEVKSGNDQKDPKEFYKELTKGKKLILSIDGGGTKGLLPLYCLQKLEELAGEPCYKIFDFYAGTSTGAIIAAALACRMKAEEIIKLYKGFIQEVFPPPPKRTVLGAIAKAFLAIARQFGLEAIGPEMQELVQFLIANELKYVYNHQKLWELIGEHICKNKQGKPITLKDIYTESKSEFGKPKRLLITLKDVERSETLFAVNAGPGAEPFQDMPLVYAVLASAVAPVYLEPFRVWVDGGVGSYSNPCYRAMLEATEYFTGEAHRKREETYETRDDDDQYIRENIIHFSFGTGYTPNFKRYGPGGKKDPREDVSKMIFFDWMRYVISEQLDEADNDQVLLTQRHFSNVDFRRYQLTLDLDLLEADINDGGLGIKIPPRYRKCIPNLTMVSSGNEDIETMEFLGKAWADAIGYDFSKPHYPYDNKSPYWPVGAVPLSIPGKLKHTVPSAIMVCRNKNLKPLPDYLNGKVNALKADKRYGL